jgi:methyl-accepting chemotaxis protein
VTPTERLLSLVRRTLRGAAGRAGVDAGRLFADHAQTFDAHDRATHAAEAAMTTCQAAGATAAQQRTALDTAADQSRLLLARGRELRGTGQQLRESLERLKLVALNAGLEAARLGEPTGRAIGLLAEEVRALSERALDSQQEQAALLGELDSEREKIAARVEEARERAVLMADELLRAQASQREAATALAEVGKGLRRATGTDPELARGVAKAAEHARGLLDALVELVSRGQARKVLETLRPTLQPLLRLLRELDDGSHRRLDEP